MANKRTKESIESGCTQHIVHLCNENKMIVMNIRNILSLKHQSSISEAVNHIIKKYREANDLNKL